MTWIATVGITWDGGRAEPGEAVPDAVLALFDESNFISIVF